MYKHIQISRFLEWSFNSNLSAICRKFGTGRSCVELAATARGSECLRRESSVHPLESDIGASQPSGSLFCCFLGLVGGFHSTLHRCVRGAANSLMAFARFFYIHMHVYIYIYVCVRLPPFKWHVFFGCFADVPLKSTLPQGVPFSRRP